MKSLTQAVILFAMLFTIQSAKAQSNQAPHLFDAFSNTISCNNAELERMFTFAEGSTVQVSLGTNFIFRGNVLSNVQKFSNLRTVLIKSTNFDGTLFSISKRTNDDNTITFVGRILNKNYADGYELVKQGNDYSLNKIKHEDILQDK